MTTKQTPGPWQSIHLHGKHYCVAEQKSGVGLLYNEANARLIAAAPELLDALKLLFEDWVTLVGDDCEDNEVVRRIWQACQDALTKATGEPVMAA